MQKFLLFCFCLFFGGLFFLFPKSASASQEIPKPVRDDKETTSQNQITVSAVVLEHLTVIKQNGEIRIETNLKSGGQMLIQEGNYIFVAKI